MDFCMRPTGLHQRPSANQPIGKPVPSVKTDITGRFSRGMAAHTAAHFPRTRTSPTHPGGNQQPEATRPRPPVAASPCLRGGCGASRSTCRRARQPGGVWPSSFRASGRIPHKDTPWDGIAVACPQPLPAGF
jgi:hypothetical protein